MGRIFISIIVPVFNAEGYILEALNSIDSQSYNSYEVLVIDDASTDNTFNVISEYIKTKSKFKLFKNATNKGVAETRNKGCAISSYSYLAFLDADDIWHEDKLESCVNEIIKTDTDLICSSYNFINDTGANVSKPYLIENRFFTYKEILDENIIGCSTVILKKNVFMKFKFNKKYAHEDYMLWLELSYNNYKIYGISGPLVSYRKIKGSRSNNKLKAAINRWKIYLAREDLKFSEKIKHFLNYTVRAVTKHLR